MLQFRLEFAPCKSWSYTVMSFDRLLILTKRFFELGGSEAEFLGRVDVFAPKLNQPNIY